MRSKLLPLLLTCLVISSCSMGLFLNQQPPLHSQEKSQRNLSVTPPPPNFTRIPAGKARKKAFIDYLTPLVTAENERLHTRRQDLLNIQQLISENRPITTKDQQWLDQLAKTYRVSENLNNKDTVARLLVKVDTIPNSLALAQASMETAWGTSRFAKEGNNYFGQWCFSAGCGLVPQQRNSGKNHEVKQFKTASNSIRSYMRNLNSHPSYRQLRKIREQHRNENRYTSGCHLTIGLKKYSERGLSYVNSLNSIIRVNKLEPTQYLKECKKHVVIAQAQPETTLANSTVTVAADKSINSN